MLWVRFTEFRGWCLLLQPVQLSLMISEDDFFDDFSVMISLWRSVWRRLEEDPAARRCSHTALSRSLGGRSGSTTPGGMEAAGAYGARKAGSVRFDPVAYFTHPRTILRLLSWVSRLLLLIIFLCNVLVSTRGRALWTAALLSPSHISETDFLIFTQIFLIWNR